MVDPDRAPLIHELDQLQAFLSDFAPVLASFHARLVDNGLKRTEATDLTRALLVTMYQLANDER